MVKLINNEIAHIRHLCHIYYGCHRYLISKVLNLEPLEVTSVPAIRSIYTWVRFRIRLAHFPKYKNNYILKNGLAYCEIALRNRTCK